LKSFKLKISLIYTIVAKPKAQPIKLGLGHLSIRRVRVRGVRAIEHRPTIKVESPLLVVGHQDMHQG